MASSSYRTSSSSQWAISRIASPTVFPSISIRIPARRIPPPPPTPQSKSRRTRSTRIPVTQITIPESESSQNPFADFYSSSSSSSVDFNPTASIRQFKSPQPVSTRVWELQSMPCTEERCKLVAGKILNRGGRPRRYSRGSACRSVYVPSSLSNVVLVDGDD